MEKANEGKKDGKRGEWASQSEFILACIGCTVGLGNVWSFPFLCFKNGGAIFLIPYTIFFLLAGLPLYYMELCVGQLTSLGPVGALGKMAPIMQGVGWGMVTLSYFIALYYNVIIAYVLFYLFASMGPHLQWETCSNSWNTEKCYSQFQSYDYEVRNFSDANFQEYPEVLKVEIKTSPAEEYFENYVLNQSDSLESFGPIQLKLVLSLFGAWFTVFLFLIKGIKSYGKVVYFTATIPFIILLVLFIRGITLDGALEGIKWYFFPGELHKLSDIKIWKDAGVTVFYSLGVGFGSLVTLSSYSKRNSNCFRDALVVTFMYSMLLAYCDYGTSVFSGLVVFSFTGFRAQMLGKSITRVANGGFGLAFISFPDILNMLPFAPLWAVLFFVLLLSLALGTQCSMVLTVTTALMDQFPGLQNFRTSVAASVCFVLFTLGIPMCSRSGIYILMLLDVHLSGYGLVLLTFLAVVTVMYIYGISQFYIDVEMMLGKHTGNAAAGLFRSTSWFWIICWLLILPICLLLMFVQWFVYYRKTFYGSYEFSSMAEGIGFAISALPWLMVPLFMVIKLISNRISRKPFMDLLHHPENDYININKQTPENEKEQSTLKQTTPYYYPTHAGESLVYPNDKSRMETMMEGCGSGNPEAQIGLPHPIQQTYLVYPNVQPYLLIG